MCLSGCYFGGWQHYRRISFGVVQVEIKLRISYIRPDCSSYSYFIPLFYHLY